MMKWNNEHEHEHEDESGSTGLEKKLSNPDSRCGLCDLAQIAAPYERTPASYFMNEATNSILLRITSTGTGPPCPMPGTSM